MERAAPDPASPPAGGRLPASRPLGSDPAASMVATCEATTPGVADLIDLDDDFMSNKTISTAPIESLAEHGQVGSSALREKRI